MGERMDRTKGKIKQSIGSLTGNKDLKRDGEREEQKGRVKEAAENVREAGRGAAKETKQAIKSAAE